MVIFVPVPSGSSLYVSTAVTAMSCNGPKAPSRRRIFPACAQITRACWTDPPPGSFSQKQPPARASMLMLLEAPDQVCAESHQMPTLRVSAAYAAGGLATVVTVDSIMNIADWTSRTSASEAVETTQESTPRNRLA